jgi:chromate reductase
MGQPEGFLSAKDLFDAAGGIASESSRKFLQDWMERYVSWVRKYAA